MTWRVRTPADKARRKQDEIVSNTLETRVALLAGEIHSELQRLERILETAPRSNDDEGTGHE